MMVAVLWAPAVATAQEPPAACGAIGCVSGASVDVSELGEHHMDVGRMTACVNERCRRFSATNSRFKLNTPGAGGERSVRMRVVVYGPDGRVLVRASRSVRLRPVQPNGPNCPPTCWVRSLRLEIDSRRLTAED
jgi:hypothetical protein